MRESRSAADALTCALAFLALLPVLAASCSAPVSTEAPEAPDAGAASTVREAGPGAEEPSPAREAASVYRSDPYIPRAEVVDEVDALLEKLRPPARFAGHVPEFSVTKREHSFEHLGGPEKMAFHVVKDRDRVVALIPAKGFHGGTIYVQDFRPTHAPREVKVPAERWHIDTAVGTELRTDAFIPTSARESEATYDFTKGEGTLTLVRRYSGTTKFKKWAHKARQPITVDTTNAFVFKCDPVLGYVVEGTFDNRVKPAPKVHEYYSAATSGRYSVWPGEETCYRVAITPTYRPGFEGYHLNLAAIEVCDNDAKTFTCRDGGFASFLNDRTGWSPTTTIRGGRPRFVVCNVHADLDFVTPWPGKPKVDADGLARNVVRTRILALPPEVTKHVWETMSVRFADVRKVQIRVGAIETFDDQPLPLTTRVRGLAFTHNDPELSEEHARSGTKSLVVKGTAWPNLPQVPLKPNARYRLTAWIKVVPWTPGERQAKEAAERERVAKRNRELEKKGKPLEEFKGPGEPEAYITGHLYEWSPHSGKWVVEQRTSSATPGGAHRGGEAEWQKVSLEFTAPGWGPFVNIVFKADACTAYVDDFSFMRVDGGE